MSGTEVEAGPGAAGTEVDTGVTVKARLSGAEVAAGVSCTEVVTEISCMEAMAVLDASPAVRIGAQKTNRRKEKQ